MLQGGQAACFLNQQARQVKCLQYDTVPLRRFAELYQQLAMYDGLSDKGRFALLSLLQQLTEQGAVANASGIIRYKPLQLPKVGTLVAACLDAVRRYNDCHLFIG